MKIFYLLLAILLVMVKEAQSFLSGSIGRSIDGSRISNSAHFRRHEWIIMRKGESSFILKASNNMDLFGGGSTGISPSVIEDEDINETMKVEETQSSSKGTKMSINLKLMEEELQRTNAKREPGQ